MISFDPAVLAPDFKCFDYTVVVTIPGSGQVIPPNASRVCLILSASVGGTTFRWGQIPVAGLGWFVNNNTIQYTFPYYLFGALVGQAWFYTMAQPGSLYATEVVYQPKMKVQ
jgi:hypothetical protein